MSDSKNQPMRFALIGAGAIAGTHSDALLQSDVAELSAVVDVNLQAAQEMAAKHGAEAHADLDSLFQAGEFDAAIVCTPPDSHPDICCRFLETGIHVLCEKPIAVSSLHAQKMFDAAEKGNAILTMASKFRFVKDVQKARDLIAEGVLGQLVLFENMFTCNVDMSKRWNSDPTISGGGVLIDNGTHSVDIMRFLLGPLADLQVVEGKRVQDIEVEDTVKIFVRSQSDVMGDIDLSWSINKDQPYFINLYGSEGTLHVGWGESKYKRNDEPEWHVFGSGYNKVQCFVDQIENFVGAIRSDEELIVGRADALASVEVVETAYFALSDSQWHTIGAAQSDKVKSH
jgi:predicted dehydrogenase